MRVRLVTWASLDPREKEKILSRSEQDISAVTPLVREIVEAVRADGDAALLRYTRRFDGVDLSGVPLAVSEQEFAEAEQALSAAVKEAVLFCADSVRVCHERQLPIPMNLSEVRPGGLGVHLIHTVCDEAVFLPPPPGVGNLFKLTKRFGSQIKGR